MNFDKDTVHPVPLPAERPDVTRPKTDADEAIAATLEREARVLAKPVLERPRRSFAEVRKLVAAGVLPKVAP